MKRRSPIDINHDLTQIREQIERGSISTLREGLFSLIQELSFLPDASDDIKKEAERLLSLDCFNIVSKVPEEIWKKVFLDVSPKPEKTYGNDYDLYLLDFELEFRKIACISKAWSSIVEEFLPELNVLPPGYSPWILMKYRNRNL